MSRGRPAYGLGFAPLALKILALCLGVQAAPPAQATPTAEDYKNSVMPCMRARDYACAEKNWTQYVRLRPSDSNGVANLGIVMNLQGKHEQAVAQFKKAIAMGEGTYDLFAYLARSLEALGRIDEAIDWSYKALAIVPDLVDVRGDLAKMLVAKGRHYEALSLLAAQDAKLESTGGRPYFEGQRIAIESSAPAAVNVAGAAKGPQKQAFRVAKFGDHFYVPVGLGSAASRGFLLDTGASVTTVSEEFLASTKAPHIVVDPAASVRLADGRRLRARELTLATVRVGPFELHDVKVLACRGCSLLLGQSTLARFDLNTSRTQGVEFISLRPRSSMTTQAERKTPPPASPDAAPKPTSAGLALARECRDLDQEQEVERQRIDAAYRAGKEEFARVQHDGRELADMRHGLANADAAAIDAYNQRVEAQNQAITAGNQRAEQLDAEQERFNNALLARNKKCSKVALNDSDYRTFVKERDARRKAAQAAASAASAP